MVNDLPVNVDAADRIRQPLGGTPPVFAYFIDDNVYNREGQRVLGQRRIERRHPAARADRAGGGGRRRAQARGRLQIEKLTVILESGPKPNRVTIDTGSERRVVDMAPSSQQTFELGDAARHAVQVPIRGFRPTTSTCVNISSSTGFVPMFENGAPDSRFLGVMVRIDAHLRGAAVVATIAWSPPARRLPRAGTW